MTKLFVSYAREDNFHVDRLVRVISGLGYGVWVDKDLHGGQAWWDEIIRQITECDAFLTIVSRASLNSLACDGEYQYATVLRKPVLAIAVEPLSQGLPQTLSLQQIVDYSQPGENAFIGLAQALSSLPPAPPLPPDLPKPPPAPLHTLTRVADVVGQPEQLTYDQQCWVVDQLRPSLNSADPEVRRGAQQLLDRFGRRNDVLAQVAQMLVQLSPPPPLPPPPGEKPPPGRAPYPPPPARKHSKIVTTFAVIGAIVVGLIILLVMLGTCSSPSPGPSPGPSPVICHYDNYGNYVCR